MCVRVFEWERQRKWQCSCVWVGICVSSDCMHHIFWHPMSCRTNRLLLTPVISCLYCWEVCVWRQNSWVLLTGSWTFLWLSSNGPGRDRETGDFLGHRANKNCTAWACVLLFLGVYIIISRVLPPELSKLMFRRSVHKIQLYRVNYLCLCRGMIGRHE